MTIRDTLTGPVAADLAEIGLTLVLSDGPQSTGDAWCDATDNHGERVALIHLSDGSWVTGTPRYNDRDGWVAATTLYVSYPWDDTEAGANIYDVLRLHGLAATWDRDGTRAIVVKLDA